MAVSAAGESANGSYIKELEEMLEAAQLSLKEQIEKEKDLQLKLDTVSYDSFTFICLILVASTMFFNRTFLKQVTFRFISQKCK